MKVVRCGGPALRPVVEKTVAGSQLPAQLEEHGKDPFNPLGGVPAMGDGEVFGENGIRVAEDQVLGAKGQTPLPRREMRRTEKALPLPDGGLIHFGR